MGSSYPLESSSLDRFLWDKGTALTGIHMGSRGGYYALLINSGVQLALATTFVTIGALGRFNAAEAFVGLGAIFGCVGVCLGLGARTLGNRLKAEKRDNEARLSKDGMALVVRLLHHIGWASWLGANHFGQRPGGIGSGRTCAQVLNPTTYELLNAAAAHFNRISGVMSGASPAVPPSLEAMAGSIREAANEVMVNILNRAAAMERVPESAETLAGQVRSELQMLEELADRISKVALVPPTLTEQYTRSTTMQAVLDQLRHDDIARAELGLGASADGPENQIEQNS